MAAAAMKFYNLTSIVSSQKVSFPMRAPSESFFVPTASTRPYIEPTFEKVAFETERPRILLVSAVGATGKSALANKLASQTGLPLLDLAKHKPVADNTLTGLLTSAFRVEDLSAIFQGLSSGTYGVIVDGVDEARSKTTEKGFEAFLDDLLRLSDGSPQTCFVLLGRTQVLEDCWLYLSEKGDKPGLLTILPFDVERARAYIDAFATQSGTAPRKEYYEARDGILERLGAAFAHGADVRDSSFLSFIGYPPVLDAIVALLSEERNYYRLKGELESQDLNDVEIGLVYRIVAYILRREREEKVIPNIVRPLVAALPEPDARDVLESIFDHQEQAFRLIMLCQGREAQLQTFKEGALNDQYEKQLSSWVVEHPFIVNQEFRSSVFEAASVALLLASGDQTYIDAAVAYAGTQKGNFHLLYLLHHMLKGEQVPLTALRPILSAAMEFHSTATSVELSVETTGGAGDQLIDIDVVVSDNVDRVLIKAFLFRSSLVGSESVVLGPRLMSSYVSLPCDITLAGAPEMEFTAPVEIHGKRILLQGTNLVLRTSVASRTDNTVVISGEALESSLTEVTNNGVEFSIALADPSGVAYPAHQYTEQREPEIADARLKEKFLRLKRILVHFRSHSKGALAKYRYKIEHERVLGTESGPAILERLLRDGVLTRDGSFYFVEPSLIDRHLGVSWVSLSKGKTSAKLLQYLSEIN